MAGAPMLDVLEHDPHAALRELREREGPVAWVDALGAWLVLTRERALEVMRDDATFTVQDPRFTTGRVVGPSMLTLDGDEHARHRAPFARPFRRAAVLERFTPLVETEAARLAHDLRPGADARRGFAGPLAAAMVTHALGLERVGVERVLGWYDAIVGAVTELTAGRPLPPAGAEGFAALRDALLASGVPDDEAGELPKAFVVRRPGSDVTAEDIQHFVDGHVSSYKRIRLVEFIDEIPKSPSGKILRRLLRDRG